MTCVAKTMMAIRRRNMFNTVIPFSTTNAMRTSWHCRVARLRLRHIDTIAYHLQKQLHRNQLPLLREAARDVRHFTNRHFRPLLLDQNRTGTTSNRACRRWPTRPRHGFADFSRTAYCNSYAST